jgi:hypothetical protein
LKQVVPVNKIVEKCKFFYSVLHDEKGYHILRLQFNMAVKNLKERKAPRIDGIPSEFLKNSGDKTLKKLYELICDIYSAGKIPRDFKRNVIITIPQKKKARDAWN